MPTVKVSAPKGEWTQITNGAARMVAQLLAGTSCRVYIGVDANKNPDDAFTLTAGGYAVLDIALPEGEDAFVYPIYDTARLVILEQD